MDIELHNKLQAIIDQLRDTAIRAKHGEINVPVSITALVCINGGYDREELATMTPESLGASLLGLFKAHPAVENFGDLAIDITLHEVTDGATGKTLLPEHP